MLARLRRTGADLLADPRHYHGVPMEGWFWRLTDAASGTAVVALTSVNRDRDGATWGMAALALHPGGAVAELAPTEAWADRRGPALRLTAGGRPVLGADDRRLVAQLAPDARLDVVFEDPVGWPRPLGGVGPGHLIPGLGQYWHPCLLGGRVRGEAEIGGRRVRLDGATAYAEKNWGSGFPQAGWWWGQAQGFAGRPDVCVCFAGGPLHAGPVRVDAGALVVRLGDRLVQSVRPPLPLRATGGDGRLAIRARSARHTVEVEAQARDAPRILPVPVPLERRVVHGPSAQHLAADVHVRVRRGTRTVFEGISPLGGLEHGSPSRRGSAPPFARS